MTRIYIFCEGQTEEVFVRDVMYPHFERIGIWLYPIIIRTGSRGKGGVTTYGKIKWQIEKKCKEDSTAWVTTLLDFYGLPKDFPNANVTGTSIDRAKAIAKAFKDNIRQRNFIPNLVVHEFEGLLFSAPDAFGNWFSEPDVVSRLNAVRAQFDSPEHINDGNKTAPSKRILAICKNYDKVMHGSLIALEIGLDTIRQQCPLFNAWLNRLESLAKT